jgi:hypothetical protein
MKLADVVLDVTGELAMLSKGADDDQLEHSQIC